jgi:hypothetical protein
MTSLVLGLNTRVLNTKCECALSSKLRSGVPNRMEAFRGLGGLALRSELPVPNSKVCDAEL